MAKIPFQRLLEHCLQELTHAGDIEASLRRYPEHADRLRPLLEVAQATRRYYSDVPAAPGGLTAGRERLLAVAVQQRARDGSEVSPARITDERPGTQIRKLAPAIKLMAILLAVVIGMAALGSGIVRAADESLPGDLLYPVKLAMEDVRLSLPRASGNCVDLAMRFTEERAEEIRTLTAAGRRVPEETTIRMENHIKHALTQAAWASDEERAGLLMQIAERTRAQERMLGQAQATAPQRAQAELKRAMAVCQEGAEVAEDGLGDPNAFLRRYRHRQRIPEPTREPDQATVSPEDTQEQDHDRQGDRERQQECCTPVGTPQATPRGPQPTPTLQTSTMPQATPREPKHTPAPPTTMPQPQQPGGRPEEGGKDRGGQSSGGQGQGPGRQGEGR
jgi:hypothetical protein